MGLDVGPKTLSEEYPKCAAAGLTLNFQMEYGAHVAAWQIESVLEQAELERKLLLAEIETLKKGIRDVVRAAESEPQRSGAF
jgi:hypothetical protein